VVVEFTSGPGSLVGGEGVGRQAGNIACFSSGRTIIMLGRDLRR